MRTLFKLWLAFGCLFAFFFTIGYAGIAFGAALMGQPATSVLHDPSIAPLQAVSDAVAAYHVAWPIGILVTAYLALELAAAIGRKNGIPELAWLGLGRVSVTIAGATAVAAAIINSLANGAPWVAAVVAGLLAGASFWHPAGTASSSSSSSAPPSSPPTMAKSTVALVIGALLLAAPGCGGSSADLKAAGTDVVDCIKADSGGVLALLGSLVSAAIVYATDGAGNVNTSTLKSEGLGNGSTIAGCLLADAFGKQASSTDAGSGSAAPKASPLVISPAERARVMNELYPGKHFHTPHGDL